MSIYFDLTIEHRYYEEEVVVHKHEVAKFDLGNARKMREAAWVDDCCGQHEFASADEAIAWLQRLHLAWHAETGRAQSLYRSVATFIHQMARGEGDVVVINYG